jgi:hypothetical protein
MIGFHRDRIFDVPFDHFGDLRSRSFQMSIFEQRLSSIASTKVTLDAQMHELNCLRGRVSKAQRSARNAHRTSREHHKPQRIEGRSNSLAKLAIAP